MAFVGSDNVLDIAYRLFTEPIKPPSSIRLQMQNNIDTSNQDYVDTVVFKMLVAIFTHGMKIKHGDVDGQVDLSQLSLEDMNTFRQYIKSIGFDVLFTINGIKHFQEVANPQSFESLSITVSCPQKMEYVVSFRNLDAPV